jgi:hypothetical protein
MGLIAFATITFPLQFGVLPGMDLVEPENKTLQFSSRRNNKRKRRS